MQGSFRKFGRRDPFEAARREMSFRLIQLEEDILKRFKGGQQREIMRRVPVCLFKSMRELVDAQQDLQGKISKLMIFAEQIDLSQAEEQEQFDEMLDYSLRRDRKYKEKYQEKDFHNQSTQISRIYKDKQRMATQKEYSSLIDKRMSQSQQSFDYKSNLNKNPESIRQRHHKNSEHAQQRSFNASQESILSFTDKEDAIEEQDLFSFRTQGAASPLKNSQNIVYRDSIGSDPQGKQQLISPDKRKSKASQSRQISSKKTPSRLSPSMRKSRSGKQINYDGQSLIYEWTLRSKIPRKSQNNHKVRQVLSSKALSNLLNRIRKRIELSRCVVDLINHSNPNVDSEYFANRYQLELQSRNQISNQIQSSLKNTNKWRY